MKPEETQKEIKELMAQVADLTSKVELLYSATEFPESVLEALQRNGFVRINSTLLTPFTTTDSYDSIYYYMFSNIDGKNMVFSTLDAKDFTRIDGVYISVDQINSRSHGLSNGDNLTFWSTDTPPAGITNGQSVFVINSATDSFKLSATLGGAAITITDDGTGVHYLQRINVIA